MVQVCILRPQLETMHGVVLNPNMCIWLWLTRHASWLMNSFSVRVSGRTAYEEAFDSDCKGDLCGSFREAESHAGVLDKDRRRRKASAA